MVVIWYLKKPLCGSILTLRSSQPIRPHDNKSVLQKNMTPWIRNIENSLSSCTLSTSTLNMQRKADIMTYRQPKVMSAIRYSEILCRNAPRFGRVYDKSRINGVLIERLHYSIHFSVKQLMPGKQRYQIIGNGKLLYILSQSAGRF